ncbi:MAG: hypothetical protein MPK62_02010 [Alphaproteobacteria bacterium]|nr:hypothetical protein [Alphaproteobacteria bacterium]
MGKRKWCRDGNHDWQDAEEHGGDPWLFDRLGGVPEHLDPSGARCTKCGKFKTEWHDKRTGGITRKPRGYVDNIMRWENL